MALPEFLKFPLLSVSSLAIRETSSSYFVIG